MRYTITMHLDNGYSSHEMSQQEIDIMFGHKSWIDWQKQLIRVLVENRIAVTVKNSRGNEIFYCTYTDAPNCPDHICYMCGDTRRFKKFMEYIDNNNK